MEDDDLFDDDDNDAFEDDDEQAIGARQVSHRRSIPGGAVT